MKLLDQTFPTPEENLAFDEALLERCESGRGGEVLRFWETQQYFVVLGYAGCVRSETHFDYCQENRVPILRRISGGGTVLLGPGCLNFSLVFSTNGPGHFSSVTRTNSHILKVHKETLEPLTGRTIEIQGHTDLTLNGLKFSGNCQRRLKNSLLFHGTFLLSTDLLWIEKTLRIPRRQPAYRHNRSHSHFLGSLNISRETLKEALKNAWSASEGYQGIPWEETQRLVRQKYSQDSWNLGRF